MTLKWETRARAWGEGLCVCGGAGAGAGSRERVEAVEGPGCSGGTVLAHMQEALFTPLNANMCTRMRRGRGLR